MSTAQGGGDPLPMWNQCNHCITAVLSWERPARLNSSIGSTWRWWVLLTCLSQSKQPVSQEELNSCHSLESPCRPSCLTRPASSNTLMRSIYSWGRRGDNSSVECVWAREGGGLLRIGQTHRERVGGPVEMPGWWMREKLLCSPEFGEEEFKKESLQRPGL